MISSKGSEVLRLRTASRLSVWRCAWRRLSNSFPSPRLSTRESMICPRLSRATLLSPTPRAPCRPRRPRLSPLRLSRPRKERSCSSVLTLSRRADAVSLTRAEEALVDRVGVLCRVAQATRLMRATTPRASLRLESLRLNICKDNAPLRPPSVAHKRARQSEVAHKDNELCPIRSSRFPRGDRRYPLRGTRPLPFGGLKRGLP